MIHIRLLNVSFSKIVSIVTVPCLCSSEFFFQVSDDLSRRLQLHQTIGCCWFCHSWSNFERKSYPMCENFPQLAFTCFKRSNNSVHPCPHWWSPSGMKMKGILFRTTWHLLHSQKVVKMYWICVLRRTELVLKSFESTIRRKESLSGVHFWIF